MDSPSARARGWSESLLWVCEEDPEGAARTGITIAKPAGTLTSFTANSRPSALPGYARRVQSRSDAAKRRGRRAAAAPGDDARSLIVAAASQEFVAHGYDSSSFRAIAKRAGVDPALVHHYFPQKADLFAEAVSVPVRPDRIVAQVLGGPRERIGENLVRAMLAALDDGRARDRVVGLIRTALGHEFAAAMVRQFLVREVLHRIANGLGRDDEELRATLVATQMVGLLMVRYGLRIEPLASAAPDEVARRLGPVIQWHLTGYPEGSIDEKAIDAGRGSAE